MKVVNCQAAVRHSDTFNFGTRSPVDAFKYWNPSQPQPSFQFPSKESGASRLKVLSLFAYVFGVRVKKDLKS